MVSGSRLRRRAEVSSKARSTRPGRPAPDERCQEGNFAATLPKLAKRGVTYTAQAESGPAEHPPAGLAFGGVVDIGEHPLAFGSRCRASPGTQLQPPLGEPPFSRTAFRRLSLARSATAAPSATGCHRGVSSRNGSGRSPPRVPTPPHSCHCNRWGRRRPCGSAQSPPFRAGPRRAAENDARSRLAAGALGPIRRYGAAGRPGGAVRQIVSGTSHGVHRPPLAVLDRYARCRTDRIRRQWCTESSFERARSKAEFAWASVFRR